MRRAPESDRPTPAVPFRWFLLPTLLVALAFQVPTTLRADDGSAPLEPAMAMGDRGEEGEEAEKNGEEENEAESVAPTVVYERLLVIGDEDSRKRSPGSAHVLRKAQLEEQQYSDIHRILRQIPGINIQEEEGYGLRPNIGMRGSGSERSSKITLLEDGVLIAPAPYTAPSAYYFPTVGRFESLEVRKGSSAIRQGPNTNGGVLNLISTSIPGTFGGEVNLAGGENGTARGHLSVGDSQDRFGWLFETYQFNTDGFKRLDGGGETGVDLEDYVGKFRVNSKPGARVFQALELKLGKTKQFGDETYLGLTQEDFERDPVRRYAASQEDFIDTDHEQLQLTYYGQLKSNMDLTATVYNNDFFRNWHKLERVNGNAVSSVLADPRGFADDLAVLRGEIDSEPGALRVRNNRRNYFGRGAQVVLGLRSGGSRAKHDVEVGLRYHEDEEDRLQEEDLFQMRDGRLILSELGASGSQSNRLSDAKALALFAQDTVSLGRLTLTPGLRLESVDYARRDFFPDDPTRSRGARRLVENQVDVWIPGIGVDYSLPSGLSVFGGVHKGFSPPGAGRTEDTREEESVNYEAGLRYSDGSLGLELVGFLSDYQNLLGEDTISAGGSGSNDLFNGGEVEVLGLEASWRWDPSSNRGWAVKLPLRLAYTLTRGEFKSSFESDFEPWGDVEAGDELPYLPEHQLSGSVGVVKDPWSAHLNLTFVGEMRSEAGSGPIPAGRGTDDHLVLDLSADYKLLSKLKLYLQVRNLTDEIYVAARRPAGARPGLTRTVLAGLSWDF